MSLKIFHFFFILASIGLASFFGTWSLQHSNVATGVGSYVAAVGLLVYLAWMVRKLRSFSFFAWVIALGSLLWSPSAQACAVCVGNPNSPLVKSANAGVLFLLAVVGGVLGLLLCLFIFWGWRSYKGLGDVPGPLSKAA